MAFLKMAFLINSINGFCVVWNGILYVWMFVWMKVAECAELLFVIFFCMLFCLKKFFHLKVNAEKAHISHNWKQSIGKR